MLEHQVEPQTDHAWPNQINNRQRAPDSCPLSHGWIARLGITGVLIATAEDYACF